MYSGKFEVFLKVKGHVYCCIYAFLNHLRCVKLEYHFYLFPNFCFCVTDKGFCCVANSIFPKSPVTFIAQSRTLIFRHMCGTLVEEEMAPSPVFQRRIPADRGAQRTTVHGVAKIWTWLSTYTHTCQIRPEQTVTVCNPSFGICSWDHVQGEDGHSFYPIYYSKNPHGITTRKDLYHEGAKKGSFGGNNYASLHGVTKKLLCVTCPLSSSWAFSLDSTWQGKERWLSVL